MIKGVHMVRIATPGRDVRWYVYAWRGGPLIMKKPGPARPRLTREHVALIKEAHDRQCRIDPALLLSLIRQWRSESTDRRSSPEWEAFSPGTKRTWGSALDLIETKWGVTPLDVWNDPRMASRVVAWRDSRAATPRAADIGVTVLRALLEFGRLHGRVMINVAANIPTLYRNGQRAEIVWSDDDIARFTTKANELGRPHVVDGLRLAALTGLRREDLVTLTWSQVGEFAIQKKALKRSGGQRRYMTMPRIPALNELLIQLKSRFRKPGVETVLVNSYGDPWTGDGFGGSFNRVRDAAAISHIDDDSGKRVRKHLHDVRGTFCTRLLIDGGLSDTEAAGIMGWSTERVATIRRVYVDQTRVVVALGERLRAMK